ncbi:hypothetical protein AAFN47_24535 [Hoeflea sp. CAU 1731]
MNTSNNKPNGRASVAGTVDFSHSDAEQIDRAENEGMTLRTAIPHTKQRASYHPPKTRTLNTRMLAYERILRSISSLKGSVADRIWPAPSRKSELLPRGKRKSNKAKTTTDVFQIMEKNGIWNVTENGHFYGDFLSASVAAKAVENARLNGFINRRQSLRAQ